MCVFVYNSGVTQAFDKRRIKLIIYCLNFPHLLTHLKGHKVHDNQEKIKVRATRTWSYSFMFLWKIKWVREREGTKLTFSLNAESIIMWLLLES